MFDRNTLFHRQKRGRELLIKKQTEACREERMINYLSKDIKKCVKYYNSHVDGFNSFMNKYDICLL